MNFFWKEIDHNKYCIVFAKDCNTVKTVNTKLAIIKLLNITNYQYESFLRSNGAKKHIDGCFYFNNKENILNVVNQLNKIKKSSR